MSALLWAVILSSTLAWASFDVLRKRLAGKIPTLELALWLCLAQVPFCVAWWLLGPGAAAGLAAGHVEYLLPALASVAFNVLANLCFLAAVGRADLGATVPLLSLTPVFVALGSIPLLDEHLGLRNWAGILLVTGGALFLPEVESARPSLRERAKSLLGSRSSVLMIATAALWALTPVCDKLALEHVSLPVHAAFLAGGVAAGTGLVFALRERSWPRLPWASGPLVLLAGGVSVVALGLQFVAISSVVVSVFEAFKRAVGVLLALGLGALFFRERPSRGRVLAGLVMALGVVLVLLPAG